MLCGCAQHTGRVTGCPALAPASWPRTRVSQAWSSPLPYSPAAVSEHPGWELRRGSVALTGIAALLSLHLVTVLHGTMVCNLHRLADVGLAPFQHLLLVQILIHTQRHQFGAGQPLPTGKKQTAITEGLPPEQQAQSYLTPPCLSFSPNFTHQGRNLTPSQHGSFIPACSRD